jgi:hypothetical protein
VKRKKKHLQRLVPTSAEPTLNYLVITNQLLVIMNFKFLGLLNLPTMESVGLGTDLVRQGHVLPWIFLGLRLSGKDFSCT